MVHSMRSTPPSLHTEALRKFDEEVRSTFCAITGLMPDPASWNQACRGTAHAGLGLRQSALHAPAAYIAPTAASRALSVGLDAAYSLGQDANSSPWRLALAQINGGLADDGQIPVENALTLSQKQISAKIDAAGR